MRRFAIAVFTIAAVGVLAPSTALAQSDDSDQILAKATIIQTLQVQGLRDLEFGTALGGATVTIDFTEPAAGKFEIAAAPGNEVAAQFTQLPSALSEVGGAATVPLTLTAASAEVDDPSAATEFDVDPGVVTGTFPPSGKVFIWIGGTITPAADQSVGEYEATIELTAAYTGN